MGGRERKRGRDGQLIVVVGIQGLMFMRERVEGILFSISHCILTTSFSIIACRNQELL